MDLYKERDAFMKLLEWMPLSTEAIRLWLVLLHLKHASWSEEFPVSTPVLKDKTGLTAISFLRARRELVKNGFIEYRKQGWKSVPLYQLEKISLEETA